MQGFHRRLDWRLAAVLTLALLSRLLTLWLNYRADPSRIVEGDTVFYEDSARALVELHRFSMSPSEPDMPMTVRTPGYPAFLAANFEIFGERLLPAIVVQIFVSVGTLILVFWIAGGLWDTDAALCACALLALDPISFISSQIALSETVFTFLITASLVFGIQLLTEPAPRRLSALYCGLCIALAAQVRPTAYFLAFPFAAGIAAFGIYTRWSRERLLAMISLLLLPWLAIDVTWQLRNRALIGDSSFSTLKGHELFNYKARDVLAYRDGISLDQAFAELKAGLPDTSGWPLHKTYALYDEKATEIILPHPFLLLRSIARSIGQMMLIPGETELLKHFGVGILDTGCMGDLLRMRPRAYVQRWVIENPGLLATFIVATLYLGCIYVGFVLGLGTLGGTRIGPAFAHAMLLGTVAFFMLISGMSEAFPRHRVQVAPELAMYSGAGWATWMKRRKRGAAQTRGTSGTLRA